MRLNRNAIMIPVFIVSLAVMAVTNVFTDEDLWVLTGCICLICSVSLFCTFKNFNMGGSRAIAAAASTAFGIYLIHDNIYVRYYLWQELLECKFHAYGNYFIVFAIAAVLAVFIACMAIDALRQAAFKAAGKLISYIKSQLIRRRNA